MQQASFKDLSLNMKRLVFIEYKRRSKREKQGAGGCNIV